MAGYTSRILLTFTIPFFGFVLWFLKKKKSTNSIVSKDIQSENSRSSALFEKHIFEFDIDSTLHQSQENSWEDKSAMQLKETQTADNSQQNGISHDSVQQNGVQQNGASHDCVQQNGVSGDCTQQNGVSQSCVQENGASHDCTQQNGVSGDCTQQNGASLDCVQQNGVSGDCTQQNGVSGDCTQQIGVSQSCVQQNGASHDCVQQNGVSGDSTQQNGASHDFEQQNGVSHDCVLQDNGTQIVNDVPQTNVQRNGVSDNAIPNNISRDSLQDKVKQNNVQEKSTSSNCAQQKSISQKNVLHNGTQQNGTSKGRKKKSKGREKSNTCPADIINSNERLHLEGGIELVQRFDAIDLNVPTKNELLNAVNKNEMDTVNGTNCDSQSSSCVNGDSNPETDLSIVKNEESAKECGKEMHVTDERNSNNTQSLQTVISSEQISSDPCSSLILPVDCASAVQTNGEMMGSPGTSYCDSLGSSDSGRGGSEIHCSPTQENVGVLSYGFEIPQKLVGLLIGRQGKNVNFIKQQTNADILIKRHPTSNQNKICLITGTEDEINAALRKIREKFPPERFPNVTLSQICFMPFMPCPENLMLRLPEGSSFDVMLSATVTAGHFFLQQPTHPTFHSLLGLTYQMTEMYNLDLTAPTLPHMEKGFICAANLSNCWYRAEVDEVFSDTDECRVKFLDYGGYSILPRAALRQINYQFMHVPFQATECYIGLVTLPEGKTEWSPQATAYFEELAQGQILQGFIVAYAENGVPYVQLYRITGVEHIDINMALVQKGHARYIKPEPAV